MSYDDHDEKHPARAPTPRPPPVFDPRVRPGTQHRLATTLRLDMDAIEGLVRAELERRGMGVTKAMRVLDGNGEDITKSLECIEVHVIIGSAPAPTLHIDPIGGLSPVLKR